MHSYLRQSTASQSRILGPFLSDSDGKTPLTNLAIVASDVKLMANGGAATNKNSGGGTHRVNGEYGLTLDASDTATVGELTVSIVIAGALPVRAKFVVLEEAVYDALFAAGSQAQVDLVDAPNSAARTSLAQSLLDLSDGVETDWTLRQFFRVALGLFAGNSTGGGTQFTNPAGTKTRLTATIDASGNRTVTGRDVS